MCIEAIMNQQILSPVQKESHRSMSLYGMNGSRNQLQMEANFAGPSTVVLTNGGKLPLICPFQGEGHRRKSTELYQTEQILNAC